MRSGEVDVASVPDASVVLASLPFTYSRSAEPSNVSARCVHVPPFSCEVPYALRSLPAIAASAAGCERFELAYRPKTRSPGRSFTATARHVAPTLFGSTHASAVNVETRSDGLSGTVTHELDPSNENAPPYLPDETHVV